MLNYDGIKCPICSPCLWASPLRGSWWRVPSRRRLSQPTHSLSMRWDKTSWTTFFKTWKFIKFTEFLFAGVHLPVPSCEDPASKCQGGRGGTRKEWDEKEGKRLLFQELSNLWKFWKFWKFKRCCLSLPGKQVLGREINLAVFHTQMFSSRLTRTGSTRSRLALCESWKAGSSCNTISLSLRWAVT